MSAHLSNNGRSSYLSFDDKNAPFFGPFQVQ